MNRLYNNLSIENLTKTEWFNQFNQKQQEKIIEGLNENLNVFIYAKPEYNSSQMREIKEGLENKLDISIYAIPEYSYEKMRKIKETLLNKKSTL